MAAISSTSSEKGLLNNVFHLIVMEASSATFLTCGFLSWLIPLNFCPGLVSLASHGLESVSATAHFCWELWGLERNVTGIKAIALESLLCWEHTGPDADVDRELSTDGEDEAEANDRLLRALGKVCFGEVRAAVDKSPVGAFDPGGFGVGVTKSRRSSSSVSSKSAGTSVGWSSVSLTSGGFCPTSAWHKCHRV